MNSLHLFLTGVTAMGFFVAATFFFRFWRDTRDRLFALFSVAFAGLAINRALLGLIGVGRESQPYLYLFRLAAFLLIAWAVIDKNRR
ncbi:MAG TPA: DUF5985 family protein [Labilithrix sp.]|jgi:hypothetical protein|nr:DUF5985 family protein [Labilithrix sp.]